VTVKTKFDYPAYLLSDAWAKKKKAALFRARNRCQYDSYLVGIGRCRTTRCLQVHHLTYAHIGDERDHELIVVCPTHHAVLHLLPRKCVKCNKPVFTDASAAGCAEEFFRQHPGVSLAGLDETFSKRCYRCRAELNREVSQTVARAVAQAVARAVAQAERQGEAAIAKKNRFAGRSPPKPLPPRKSYYKKKKS